MNWSGIYDQAVAQSRLILCAEQGCEHGAG